MPKTLIKTMKSLINKKVKVYSGWGLYREGVLKSVNDKDFVLEVNKGKQKKNIVFNRGNVFMVEEK
jgi:hypothetical protein